MKIAKFEIIFSALLALLLVGCSSSGSRPDDPPSAPPQNPPTITDPGATDPDTQQPVTPGSVGMPPVMTLPVAPGTASIGAVPATFRDAVKAEKTLDANAAILVPVLDPTHFIYDGKNLLDVEYSLTDIPLGFNTKNFEVGYSNRLNKQPETLKGIAHIYNQTYSVIWGEVYTEESNGGLLDGGYLGLDMTNRFFARMPLGLITPIMQLDNFVATGAHATYNGKAFDGSEQGNLSYTVDFGAHAGKGTITGLQRSGNITLTTDNVLSGIGVAKVEHGTDAIYGYSFYGPKAEEIAGNLKGISFKDSMPIEIIFGGARN